MGRGQSGHPGGSLTGARGLGLLGLCSWPKRGQLAERLPGSPTMDVPSDEPPRLLGLWGPLMGSCSGGSRFRDPSQEELASGIQRSFCSGPGKRAQRDCNLGLGSHRMLAEGPLPIPS